MCDAALHIMYESVVIAKLTYTPLVPGAATLLQLTDSEQHLFTYAFAVASVGMTYRL